MLPSNVARLLLPRVHRLQTRSRILRRISGQASSASHRGASNILALIDDFVIPAHDTPASSHQCIVTELVLPLHSWLGELKEAWLLMRQLVEAFDFLHANGIVHGVS